MSDAAAERFGMWLFLASEMLLFAALITLYSAGRALHPAAFAEGISHNLRWLGSVNTLLLITSSFTVALAVHQARRPRSKSPSRLLAITFLLGLAFLGFKTFEYAVHLSEGASPGVSLFLSLYYLTTGAHAFHVIVGLTVIAVLIVKVRRRPFEQKTADDVELGALYWHLVDVIWIFLWPLYYLTGGAR